MKDITILCGQCNRLKVETDFIRCKGKRIAVCLACKARYRNRIADEAIAWIKEQKFHCMVPGCMIDDSEMLEFHHRVRAEKKYTISKMIGRYRLPAIQKELAKCDPICANHHQKITTQEAREIRKKQLDKLIAIEQQEENRFKHIKPVQTIHCTRSPIGRASAF